MKLLVLILFGVLTAMIDSSEGLSCYQCIKSPDQGPEWNQGDCTDSTKDPPSDSLKPCDGTHSAFGMKAIEKLKEKGGNTFIGLLAQIEKDGVPTCVIAKGTYEGKEYTGRDCAMVSKGWHKCEKRENFPVGDKQATNIVICACNTDKCNGNEGSAGGGGGGNPGDKPSSEKPGGGGSPNKDDPDGGVGSISLNCALILMTLAAVIFNF